MAERLDPPSLSPARARRARWPSIASFAAASASRLNAQRSTGLRTPAGKAKAARNSRHHGLSISVLADPALAREVEACARRIVTQKEADRQGGSEQNKTTQNEANRRNSPR